MNTNPQPPTRWLIVVLVLGAGAGLIILGSGISLLSGDKASAIQIVVRAPCCLAGALALMVMREAPSVR